MRVRTIIGLALLGLVLGLFPGVAQADHQPGELLVVFDSDVASTSQKAQRAHAVVDGNVVEEHGRLNLEVVEVEDIPSAIDTYRRMPGVKYVERNHSVSIAGAPNDPLYDLQWHLQPRQGSNKGSANVEPAWSKADGQGVVIAVIDTGVRASGSDLASSRILQGKDFVNDDDNADDDHGHGTHIAGTIAQSTNNDRGVAGVAPAAKILPVKALDAVGAGTYSDVINSISWAVDKGADVINLSLTGATYSQALCDAVADAANHSVVVAASGNSGLSVQYPAACDGAIAVGAVRYDGQRTSYSNRGSALDLVAPGGDSSRDQNGDGYEDSVLQQTFADTWGYRWFEGTSMAAAHVSGVAALILDVNEKANVPKTLRDTARDLGAGGRDNDYGHGLIDAAAAVNAAQSDPSGGSVSTGGYQLVTDRGALYAFGDAPFYGAATNINTVGEFVTAMMHPSGKGYYLVTDRGAIYTFGDVPFFGAATSIRTVGKFVDGFVHPSGDGYYLMTDRGAIYTFGDVPFFGAATSIRTVGKFVDGFVHPSGDGYYLMTDRGAIYTFGDVPFFGAATSIRTVGAFVTAMVHPSGKGYYLVTERGAIYSYGKVPFYGAATDIPHPGMVDAIVDPSGRGYSLISWKGGVYSFGSAKFYGSTASLDRVGDVVTVLSSVT